MKLTNNLIFKIFLCNVLICVPAAIFSQDYNYPSDAGLVDVTQAPYFADNTGATDATAAIQTALSDYPSGNRIIYLPNGNYLVSNTLIWPEAGGPSDGKFSKRTILQGQSRDGTVIKLKDNCPGYQDPDSRKGVLYTGPAPAQRFRNSIYRLTVNTGSGNPGASGIQFNCSNEGTMQEVKIVSGDGQGVCGLDLAFTNEIGPGYIYDLIVEGFNVGVMHGNFINSMTFEKITLRNQLEIGFQNAANVSSIRGLVSENSVTAVWNKGAAACMVLLDAQLSGGSTAVPAIINGGTLYARNIECSGYNGSIESTSGLALNIDRMNVVEYSSHEVIRLFPSPVNMLNLEVKDIPRVPWSDTSDWANPMDYGAVGDGEVNDTKAIQDAIDSGKETVYFPGGLRFAIDDTLFIRGDVRRITGCEVRLTGDGAIVFTEGTYDTVILERVDGIYNNLELIHNASRTLYYHSSTGIDVESNGSGDFFMCNIVNGKVRFNNPGQKIWVRHLNTENHDTINVWNKGATFWLMGYKTERGNTKVYTDQGGKTEIMGVHNYSTSTEKLHPWFEVKDASLSIACARETNYGCCPYDDYLKETRNGESAGYTRSEAPSGGAGSGKVIPMYSARPVTTDLPSSPGDLSYENMITDYALSWTASSEEDFNYYSIYYSENPGGPYSMLTNYLLMNEYTYTPGSPGTTYLVVTAVDTLGVESAWSDELEIIVPDYGAPAVPAGLTAERLNDTDVQLIWDANGEDYLSHYNIYRSTTGGVIYVPLATGITAASFTDTLATGEYTYDYVISSVSIFDEESGYSEAVTVFPLGVEDKEGDISGQIRVWPNPANDHLYIDNPGRVDWTAGLYSSDGKLCLAISSGETRSMIDITQFDKGLYLLRISTGRKSFTRKVIIN